jgi:NADH dehydrogenase FAD-containing subunit
VKHRKAVPEAHIKFNEVEAVEVDTKNKRVKVTGISENYRTIVQAVSSATDAGGLEERWIDYDVLVCAAGATTNTFGTPGSMEHCVFLKNVQDAMKIRSTLLDCFETAAIYGLPDDEIDRLLTFVIVGAGPTGVEIAAEIRDFVKEDVAPRYSGFANRHIRVQIVEMTDKMLGTYDKVISEYTSKRFSKQDIEMFTEHQVKRVNEKSVEVLDLKTNELKELPFGMCVWASGVRPVNVTLNMAKDVQGSRMLEVDHNLRVRGAEGSIFALGDCARVTTPTMKAAASKLFHDADINKDGILQPGEFKVFIESARKEFPHLEAYLGETAKEANLKTLSASGGITLEVFEAALSEVDREIKMLPPTAQVAGQQGAYLAKILNGVPFEELGHQDGYEPTFHYNHAGSMAYVGGEAAVIDSPVFGVSTGLLTYVMWKGAYWGKSVSIRMKVGMAFDWCRSWFLGRDTSRF